MTHPIRKRIEAKGRGCEMKVGTRIQLTEGKDAEERDDGMKVGTHIHWNLVWTLGTLSRMAVPQDTQADSGSDFGTCKR
jgi:hypothetical protein